MKIFSFFLLLFLIPVLTFAQDAEMADTFRNDGKIYVVIGVMVIILVGLFIYLFMMERKISSIEKKVSGKI